MPSLGMSDTGPRTGHAQLSRLRTPSSPGSRFCAACGASLAAGNALAVSERTNTLDSGTTQSSIDTACYFFSLSALLGLVVAAQPPHAGKWMAAHVQRIDDRHSRDRSRGAVARGSG